MDDLIDYMILTFAVLFVLFVVGMVVTATIVGVYEPILAVAFWVVLVAVVAGIASVVRWLVER